MTMTMKNKFTRSLLSSALLLATTQVFADGIVPNGSGVYFYAWTANEYCGQTGSTLNGQSFSGPCPETWTDTVKNINAQVPSTADKAMIKYIYLDSIQFNFSHSDAPLTQTIFKVGGCTDGDDITFCVSSNGLTYADPSNQNGPDAVDQLAKDLPNSASNSYYIMPMISDARDKGLMNMSQNQLYSLAYSLACIVNPAATAPSWTNGFAGPANCGAVLNSNLNLKTADANISGLAFDVENPDFSGRHYTQASGTPGPVDQTSASDFYGALQTAIGTSAGTKYIMVSRGPGGLMETNDGNQATPGMPTFGEVLGGPTGLNNNAGPKFIFSPQIYDLCDGMGNTTTSWACPIQMPFNFNTQPFTAIPSNIQKLPSYDATTWQAPISGAAYNNYQFFQAIPASPMPGSTPLAENPTTAKPGPVALTWTLFFPNGKSPYDDPLNDVPIKDMSMAYLFQAELNGKSFNSDTDISPTNVPVQLTISGGASSQIWEHVNLYNVDPGVINPVQDLPNLITPANSYNTVDFYRYPTQFDASLDVPSTNSNIAFTPSMIYTNKQFCQYENPNGSSGATIPHCISYKNPYGETVASYAAAFFTTLQYALNQNISGQSIFSGVAMYPFTPYGYFDKACAYDANTNPNACHAGFFPEVPDGLVNGQKPETSFWKTYIGQFANQSTGGGVINTTPETLLSLNSNTDGSPAYYINNGGTATVSFIAKTYPTGTPNPNISSYRANLIDATGTIVATGTSSTSPITINNAPGGNYTLQLQALASNGGVITEVEAAANNGGTPPAPQIGLTDVAVSGSPTSTSYTLSWTLNCSSSATLPPGFLAVSQLYVSGNNSPLSRLTQWIASPVCGQTYQSTFSASKGTLPSTATQASLALQQAGTFQNIAPPQYVAITIPS